MSFPTFDTIVRVHGSYLVPFVLIAMLCSPVTGQYPVDMRINTTTPQTGQMMDMNPGLYSGGMNYVRPTSPFVGGNLYASGNVARGMSLRSVSPISDPTAFRGTLGSSMLSDFRRDSVSVGDVGLGAMSLRQPYYDASRTVATSSFLAGMRTPVTPQSRTAGGIGLRLAPERLTERLMAEPIASTRLSLPKLDDGSRAPSAATYASIFGPAAKPPTLTIGPLLTRPTLPDPVQEVGTELLPTALDRRVPGVGERLSTRLDAERMGTPVSPLDTVLEGNAGSRLQLLETTPLARRAESGGEGWRPGLILPEVTDLPDVAATETSVESSYASVPRRVVPELQPGYDMFTDMRLALELREDPTAEWFKEMQAAADSEVDPATSLAREVREDASQFLGRMLDAPLGTLVGRGASAFNDQMLRAESLMDIGHFQEAIDRYERAQQLEPGNPLPLIGKGHALLAMGSYSSAATALVQGIERFPEMVRFGYDLSRLMGGGENVDIRRSDLMRRLQQHETPEMLFLLGYLEYHTGDRERGMVHLEQAAEHPRASAVISRFPAMLRGELLPVPRVDAGTLPPAEPARPQPSPRPSSGEGLVLPPPVE